MPPVQRCADYRDRYETIRVTREGGVREPVFHTEGGPLERGLLPAADLIARARDLAAQLLRYSRVAPTQDLNRRTLDLPEYALAPEGPGVIDAADPR